jgi:hypothetical protein
MCLMTELRSDFNQLGEGGRVYQEENVVRALNYATCRRSTKALMKRSGTGEW